MSLPLTHRGPTWTVGRETTDCPGDATSTTLPPVPALGGIERAMVSPSVFPGDTVIGLSASPGFCPKMLCLGADAGGARAIIYSIKFNMKSGVVLKAALRTGNGLHSRSGAGSEPGIFFINTSEATVVDGFSDYLGFNRQWLGRRNLVLCRIRRGEALYL